MFLDNILKILSEIDVHYSDRTFRISSRGQELTTPVVNNSRLSFIAPGGFLGVQYPVSRDWAFDYIPCKAHNCAANVSGYCISPACCVIGEDGKCKGYHPRVTEKDGSNDTEKV